MTHPGAFGYYLTMSKTTQANDDRIYEALKVGTTEHWNWDGQTAKDLAAHYLTGFTTSQVQTALRRLEKAGRVRGMTRRCTSEAGQNRTTYNARFWTTIK